MLPPTLSGSFRRNFDGSWTTLRAVRFSSPNGYVQLPANATFRRGVAFMGLDIATWLDQQDR